MHMKPKYLSLLCLTFVTAVGFAQDSTREKSLEIYGFAMTDMGYDFKQIDPNWFDAMRVTKLPSYANQFAPDGKVFFSVRQSRFGVAGYTPTPIGTLKAVFEFDMFGVGVDQGQTTMRLRHAYAKLGNIIVGQTNSPFMDGDIFPNTLEYWGPTGMVFFRNIFLGYYFMQGDKEAILAIERPGASADQGTFSDRTELDSVKGQFNIPDVSAHFKKSGDWGHVQLAGMLRFLKWKDIHTTGVYDISGNALGWGLNLTTVLNLGPMDVFRGGVIYGAGVENYMNDAPVDVGVVDNTSNPAQPFLGKVVPVTGVSAFIDHNWTSTLSTSIGYSFCHLDNTSGAAPSAYKTGQYAIVNLLVAPFKNAMMGAELQWGQRSNYTDGFSSTDIKLQFSFKYNFSQAFYRDKK